MHTLEGFSPYMTAVQFGLIILSVLLLAKIPSVKLMGVPATSMIFSLIVGSLIPTFLPEVYQNLFATVIWAVVIQVILIPLLGGSAGREIEFDKIRSMGWTGFKFIGISMIAPIIFAIPVAYLLVMWKGNPYIQADANNLGVGIGIVSIVFMRALPTMIAFFRGAGWKNDLVNVNISGASLDDLGVFVIIQPVVAGIMTNRGIQGIIESGSAVIVVAAAMFLLSRIVRALPKDLQFATAFGSLFIVAGYAEIFGHVHLILTGILWGIMMPRDATAEVEHKMEGAVLYFLVPLFFAGLGLTYHFTILSWEPWLLMAICFAAAYAGHELLTAPMAAKLFGGNKAAGRISAALCRTHGTADILLAISLADMGILTGIGLSGMVLYLMFSTIQAFSQAQSLVNKNPELVNARLDVVSESAPAWAQIPAWFPRFGRRVEKLPVFATPDDNEDK